MYATKTTPCSYKKKCPMFYKKREVLYPQQIIDGKELFGKIFKYIFFVLQTIKWWVPNLNLLFG